MQRLSPPCEKSPKLLPYTSLHPAYMATAASAAPSSHTTDNHRPCSGTAYIAWSHQSAFFSSVLSFLSGVGYIRSTSQGGRLTQSCSCGYRLATDFSGLSVFYPVLWTSNSFPLSEKAETAEGAITKPTRQSNSMNLLILPSAPGDGDLEALLFFLLLVPSILSHGGHFPLCLAPELLGQFRRSSFTPQYFPCSSPCLRDASSWGLRT
jgi:hypothetical protein